MRWARTRRTYLFIERGLRSMISIMYSISYIPLEKNRSFHFAPVPQMQVDGGPQCIFGYSAVFSGRRSGEWCKVKCFGWLQLFWGSCMCLCPAMGQETQQEEVSSVSQSSAVLGDLLWWKFQQRQLLWICDLGGTLKAQTTRCQVQVAPSLKESKLFFPSYRWYRYYFILDHILLLCSFLSRNPLFQWDLILGMSVTALSLASVSRHCR